MTTSTNLSGIFLAHVGNVEQRIGRTTMTKPGDLSYL